MLSKFSKKLNNFEEFFISNFCVCFKNIYILQALCCHFRPDYIFLRMRVDPNLGKKCHHYCFYLSSSITQRILFLPWNDHDNQLILLIIIFFYYFQFSYPIHHHPVTLPPASPPTSEIVSLTITREPCVIQCVTSTDHIGFTF